MNNILNNSNMISTILRTAQAGWPGPAEIKVWTALLIPEGRDAVISFHGMQARIPMMSRDIG